VYSTLLPGAASTSTDFSSRLAATLGGRPLGRNFGSHVTGVKPLLAWVPSIGISRMLEYECAPGGGSTRDSQGSAQVAAELSAWCGNLLIASLRGQTLHRVVLASEPDGTAIRVVVDEPIPLGRRMRGIRRFPNGSLAVKTDLPSLVFLWRLGT
jgi:glucose/arabinose dehydrogenase